MNTVTIAGGGLAGLSLGIALRNHDVPVRLIEAGSYPRHRVCGEFISGVSDGELQSLGIADLFQEAQRHRGTSWHEGDRELLRASLPDDARGLSRYRLDALLAQRLTALGGEAPPEAVGALCKPFETGQLLVMADRYCTHGARPVAR